MPSDVRNPVLATVLAVGLASVSAGSTCEPAWIPTFSRPASLGEVFVLAVHDDGSGAGPALYIGGGFTNAGGAQANGIARWDGAAMSALGSGANSYVLAAAVHDDGGGAGQALYVGGLFTTAGGVTVNRIARWNGGSWTALGSGLSSDVQALTVFDDGSGAGPALYAAGNFTAAGGAPANRIARWNGASWSALGAGVNGTASALAVYDDASGAGPALYAGGQFTTAGGVTVNRTARWDGSSWSALGAGTNGSVRALIVHDDASGRGPALFAAGDFTLVDGVIANRIARWDGASWSALGSGMNSGVSALTVHDDGSGAGPALYAGGGFTIAGGALAQRIARWDGSSWSSLGSGMDGAVTATAAYDDGSGAGAALYAGGSFMASAASDSFIARYGCDEASDPADVNGDGTVGFADLTEILLHWGACPKPCAPATCAPDADGNCNVGFSDLTVVLLGWG